MGGIEQDVTFHPRLDRRHKQQRRAPCREPRLAKGLADVFALAVPPGEFRGREDFIADAVGDRDADIMLVGRHHRVRVRSEEHTSELQSLMRISYAVFCLKKKTNKPNTTKTE